MEASVPIINAGPTCSIPPLLRFAAIIKLLPKVKLFAILTVFDTDIVLLTFNVS